MATVSDSGKDPGMELIEHVVDGDPALGCMQCGMCSGSCPLGDAMEFPPRQLILQARSGNLDAILSSPSLWMCVACHTCSSRCPRGIELADDLWPALREKAMLEDIQPPAELQETFKNIFKYGNMLGESPRKRLNWADNLDVPLKDLSKNPEPVEVLWLVGDYPSYYPRNQVVSREFARILNALGVNWGVLGNKEKAVGDCDRLAGEEGLFEKLVEDNKALLDQQEFEKLVVLDAHAYRALEHFYPRFGAEYPVEHYTSFLAERLEQLGPLLTGTVEKTITYHDNCCIGRRAGMYEQPRALLEAIPGVKLAEMMRNRADSLCCGGGGGGMWLDAHIVENGGERLSDRRVRMAAETGADTLAVSCPFELSRFEDAAKVVGLEGKLEVRDIVELLAESMNIVDK